MKPGAWALTNRKYVLRLLSRDDLSFLWDANSTAHLGKHGVSPQLAERVFWAGSGSLAPARIHHRWVTEAEVDGCRYRLIFDLSREGTLYAITCFLL